jgi:hypothetical protein
MINEYGAIGRMRIGRGNKSTWKKTYPQSNFVHQFPHDLTQD